jgi:uncharacterized protein (TIGR02271 family)
MRVGHAGCTRSAESHDLTGEEARARYPSVKEVYMDKRKLERDVDVNRTTAGRDVTEKAIPVVEEKLQVGKREIDKGGVRVKSHVVEQPVEERVALREERVDVERRPVDRPITAADGELFREVTLEMTEMAEEAVVAKNARVVEEVVIKKQVGEKTEQIRDSVRRTEVDVEKIPGRAVTAAEHARNQQRDVHIPSARPSNGFSAFDLRFRDEFDRLPHDKNVTYDHYRPVYRYGYDLATGDRYRGKRWEDVETEARTSWERQNPGTWERVKEAAHQAWDAVRGGH